MEVPAADESAISAFDPRGLLKKKTQDVKAARQKEGRRSSDKLDGQDELGEVSSQRKQTSGKNGEPNIQQEQQNLGKIEKGRTLLRSGRHIQQSELSLASEFQRSDHLENKKSAEKRGLRSKWAETASKGGLTATTTSQVARKTELESIKEKPFITKGTNNHSRGGKSPGQVEKSGPTSFNVSIEDFFQVFMREDPGIRKSPPKRPLSTERDSILLSAGPAGKTKPTSKLKDVRSRLKEVLPNRGRQVDGHEGSGSLPDVSRSQHKSTTQRLNMSTDRLENRSLSKTNRDESKGLPKALEHTKSRESSSVESYAGSKQNSSEVSKAIKGFQHQGGPSFISQAIRDRLTSNVKFGLGPNRALVGLLKKPKQEEASPEPKSPTPKERSVAAEFITIENSVGNPEISKKVFINDASDKFLAGTSEGIETQRTSKPPDHPSETNLANPRRFCIIENYMVNTTRPLSKLLVTSIRRFKETLFSCEKDVYEKIGLDPKMIDLLAHQPFLQTAGMQRATYLQHLQGLIETLMNALRHNQTSNSAGVNKMGVVFGFSNANKPKESGWSYSKTHPLRNDVLFAIIRKFFNPHTVFLVLVFYMRVLLTTDMKDKCLALGKILLSLSYILDSEMCRVEAYSQLGHYYEKYKDHETALFCFTRAMQHCWDCKASTSKTGSHATSTQLGQDSQVNLLDSSIASLIGTEIYLYDKIGNLHSDIGVQLYNMNELRTARLYHERMLSGFLEPIDSNAMIRSKEILVHEGMVIYENFLVRRDNYLDKYRVIASLLSLNTPPFDGMLTLERDESDNPMILAFIETVLSSQMMSSELNSSKKSSQVLQLEALLSHKDRLFNQKEAQESMTIGEVHFTSDGKRLLQDGVEYIQKYTTFLETRSKKQTMRVSHQRDINTIFNFLSSTHNSDSVRIDYEKKRTTALENAKKYSMEDFLVFLTRIRYYVIKKLNDLLPKRNDRNNRKFGKRSILGDFGRIRTREDSR